MSGRFLSFGKFRLDARTGELFKDGEGVKLPPQPAKLLLLLVRAGGDLVTRQDIEKALWPDGTFVDFEHGINKCINQVRAALEDVADEPRYIQTVARRGYRFLAKVEGAEPGERELSPYPGLSSFLEKDARFFFGREAEAEALWNKVERRRLLALIGPSGAGKSSFLRAGLVPSCPEGWRVAMGTPGNSPLSDLDRLLAPHSGPTLLVLDAFEELFTRNPPNVQKELAARLGRLVEEERLHLLLSMRDDFLFRCHEHEGLRPVFLDLTALGPLTGPELRRALVQPAIACGYRFEDESLVEEMLAAVEGHPGALPLLAFAASRLWEKRDRERRLLTRAAYEEVGGVAGALARHAESTFQGIDAERRSIVREIFRNLTTSHGTRVSVARHELLSAFDDRAAAGEVVDRLVDARLLTSSEREVVIIHESLLSAWPTLVRWQAQDTEGLVLRDQLRQAANLWEERGRPAELLWTGAPYKEFQLWRERYKGALTSTEDAFSKAMVTKARTRTRRQRAAVAVVIGILIGVVGIVSSFWRRAVDEAERREAAQILALGRLELEDRPSAALAHALASLERADSAEARRFAVEALWRGAAALVLPENVNRVDFSPDGNWIATGGSATGVRLWSIEGGSPKTLGGPDGVPLVQFSPGGDSLAAGGAKTVRFWSLPEGGQPRKVELEGDTRFRRRGSHFLSFSTSGRTEAVRDWSVRDGAPDVFASLDLNDIGGWDIDASGEQLVTGRGMGVFISPLRAPSPDRPRLVGRHEANVVWIAPHPTAPRVLSGDETGEVRIWGLSDRSVNLERTFRAPAPEGLLEPTDTFMVVAPTGPHSTSEVAYIWDLNGPPDAEPRALRDGDVAFLNQAVVHPKGLWLLTATADAGILWPLDAKYARVLRGQSAPFITVAFTPDGSSLVSTSDDGTVRLWPLSSRGGARRRILMEDKTALLGAYLAVDPSGRHVLVESRWDPRVFLVPLQGGEPRPMPGLTQGQGWMAPLAFSPDGRLAIAAGFRPSLLRIWNLQSGEVRTLAPPVLDDACEWGDLEGYVGDLKFLADGRLLTVGHDGIRAWSLEDGSSEEIRPCIVNRGEGRLAVDRDRLRFLVAGVDGTRVSTFGFYDLETGTEREITSHGNRVSSVALDPTGTIAVTGDLDGVVRVGPITGEEPHLLFGHELEISSVAVSPDGKWIASGSQDGTIRLWPMPEGQPFHTLSYEKVLERIRALTNLRVVPDEASATGYRVEVGPFPGWKSVPAW